MWRRSKPRFTLADAANGIAFLGRIGGGKTTWLKFVEAELVQQGAKVMHCCVKPDEFQTAKSVLRRKKYIRLTPGCGHIFNPFVTEMSRKGGSALTLASYHDQLNEMLTRSTSERAEAFWKTITNDTQSHAFDGVYLWKGQEASYADVYDVLLSAPSSYDEAASPDFAHTQCGKMCAVALSKGAKKIADFFMQRLTSVGEKARGAAVTQAIGSVYPFTVPPVSDLVNGKSTLSVKQLTENHVILDVDLSTYGQAGLAFQLMCKWFAQDHCLRRRGKFPYFALVQDEYHQVCHPERDIKARAIGRSQRYIDLCAYQNLPVLRSAFGGDAKASTYMEAIFGLHVNKILCSNNCMETNEACSKLLGMEKKMFHGGGIDPKQQLEWYDIFGVGRPNINFNQQWHYRFPPNNFMHLKTGGRANKLVVDAVIHRGHDHFYLDSISQR